MTTLIPPIDAVQDQGLGLHELTVLAATLEHLIHDEVPGELGEMVERDMIYMLGLPPTQDASHHQDYYIFSR